MTSRTTTGGRCAPSLSMRLRATIDAPSRARGAIAALRLPASLSDKLRLAVSEVVTNAVRHTRRTRHPRPASPDTVSMNVWVDDTVRVEVADPGPGFDVAELGRPEDGPTSGWGLLIVDRVTDRWGVASGPQTLVWFEIDRQAARPLARPAIHDRPDGPLRRAAPEPS